MLSKQTVIKFEFIYSSTEIQHDLITFHPQWSVSAHMYLFSVLKCYHSYLFTPEVFRFLALGDVDALPSHLAVGSKTKALIG